MCCLPSDWNPSCLHTAAASLSPNPSELTVLYVPPTHTSTLPILDPGEEGEEEEVGPDPVACRRKEFSEQGISKHKNRQISF